MFAAILRLRPTPRLRSRKAINTFILNSTVRKSAYQFLKTSNHTKPTQWPVKEDPVVAPAHLAQLSLHAPRQLHSASRLAHPLLLLLQQTHSTPLLQLLLVRHQRAPLHPRAQVSSLTWLLPLRKFFSLLHPSGKVASFIFECRLTAIQRCRSRILHRTRNRWFLRWWLCPSCPRGRCRQRPGRPRAEQLAGKELRRRCQAVHQVPG